MANNTGFFGQLPADGKIAFLCACMADIPKEAQITLFLLTVWAEHIVDIELLILRSNANYQQFPDYTDLERRANKLRDTVTELVETHYSYLTSETKDKIVTGTYNYAPDINHLAIKGIGFTLFSIFPTLKNIVTDMIARRNTPSYPHPTHIA